MVHSPHHSTTPHEICFVLESVDGVEGKAELCLQVGRSEEEEEDWARVLSPSLPLTEPQGCYYLLALDEEKRVEELEIKLGVDEKSFGACLRLKGDVKTRGRVLLFNEIDPSDVITITVAVLVRKLPLTPREYDEATTQTLKAKTSNRS
ncbi:hypothetical protein PFISCL1PPCAC_10699, partial [Pristionchus fissidentatus]